MNTKVKICGIRTYEHAQAAIEFGADFLGFVFVPHTKHFIHPNEAKEIINQLRNDNFELKVKLVGVFQNQSIEEVNTIAETLGLDFVQLHGEENMEYMEQIKSKIIKKIVVPTKERGEGFFTADLKDQVGGMRFLDYARNDKIKYFLLDRPIQGQGDVVDLEKAKEVSETFPTFFAGGLTPENVADVVACVKPFAVDVSSGVITHHMGDTQKIKRFIQNAKSAFIKDSGYPKGTSYFRTGAARMTFRKKGLSL